MDKKNGQSILKLPSVQDSTVVESAGGVDDLPSFPYVPSPRDGPVAATGYWTNEAHLGVALRVPRGGEEAAEPFAEGVHVEPDVTPGRALAPVRATER